MDRELDRDPPSFTDTFTHTLGKVNMNPVTGDKVAACLRYSYDWFPGAKFIRLDAEICVTLNVKSCGTWIPRNVKPFTASQS
jgi:hypothetical protein